MFSPRTILWGGVASVFAGLLWIIIAELTTDGVVPLVLAVILGLGGLAGLYSRQSGEGGWLAWSGMALGILGTALLLAALLWGHASGRLDNIQRHLALSAPPVLIISLALIILGVGMVLLGITSLRGRVPHRWRGLPLVLGLLYTLGGMMEWLVYYLPLSQGRDPWQVWSLIGGQVIYPAQHALMVLHVLLGLGWLGLGIILMTEANAQVVPPRPAST